MVLESEEEGTASPIRSKIPPLLVLDLESEFNFLDVADLEPESCLDVEFCLEPAADDGGAGSFEEVGSSFASIG